MLAVAKEIKITTHNILLMEDVGTLKTRKMLRRRSTMMARNMRLMDMWKSSKGLLLAVVGEWIWNSNCLKLFWL